MRPITIALLALAIGCACSPNRSEPVSAGKDESEDQAAPEVAGAPETGKPAPEITVENVLNWDGDPPSVASLRGKVVVLDFWTYW